MKVLIFMLALLIALTPIFLIIGITIFIIKKKNKDKISKELDKLKFENNMLKTRVYKLETEKRE